MKSTDKAKRNQARNLSVQPEDAAKVKGGWFLSFLMPKPTTKTTSTSTSGGVAGESLDSKHREEIE